ncbi:MAG TPA: LysM domain-containing protein [Nevskiaceae bacterium]|nr:LysM domain-containing protein [Nevskiaceae bacterium]
MILPAVSALALLTLSACASRAPAPVASAPAAPAPVLRTAPAAVEAPAEPVALQPSAPLEYVVKKGDTLWDIATAFLLDPYQWPEIWYVNDQVANPHLIYPGDRLRLETVNGRPRLSLAGPLERLSPRARESALEGAVPVIPIDAIRDFLRGPRLVDADTLEAAPYLLDFVDPHLLGASGNPVYVRKLRRDQGASFSVVRKGEAYRDPDSGRLLGYEAVPVAETDIREYGEIASAVLTRSYREAKPGDLLLPQEAELFEANFYPHAPGQAVDGRIISVFDGVSQIGQYQIVALNRGRVHGLEPGHVLHIRQANRDTRDPQTGRRVSLPQVYAGQLMVFKVAPQLSYGLVMSAVREIHVLDAVGNPSRAGR